MNFGSCIMGWIFVERDFEIKPDQFDLIIFCRTGFCDRSRIFVHVGSI